MHVPNARYPMVRALRIGDPAHRLVAHIAAGGEGRILGVYRSAINIRTGGSLLTLVPDAAGALPSGITLDDVTPLPDLRSVGIRPGARVTIHDGLLAIAPGRFAVSLSSAQPWSSRLAHREGASWSSRSLRAWTIASERFAPGCMASLGPARAPLAAMSAAVASRDRVAAAAAARPLVGLGPGLTPSGDDALVGVEAALHTVGHPLAGFLAAVLDDIERRTTTVSATFLRHAADGAFSERVGTVIEGLIDGSVEELQTTIGRALALGATSGSDTLMGILVGLDAATRDTTTAAA